MEIKDATKPVSIIKAQSLIEQGQVVKGVFRWAMPHRWHRKRLQYLSSWRGWRYCKQRTLAERYTKDARFVVVELEEARAAA